MTSSNEPGMVFEMTVIGDDVTTLSSTRTRERSTTMGVKQYGLAKVKANATSEITWPWYEGNNNEPEYLIGLLRDNPTLLGLIFTKVNIMYGSGPQLMERQEDGSLKAVPRDAWPQVIEDFYEYNALDDLMYQCLLDMEMLGNFFVEMIWKKSSIIVKEAKPLLIELNRITPELVRAKKNIKTTKVKPTSSRHRITHYVVLPDWEEGDISTGVMLPAYNRRSFFNADRVFEPLKTGYKNALYHGKQPLACFNVYAIPQWYGARAHIELQNEIPHWHIANIINQFGARLMISVSEDYLRKKSNLVNPDTNKKYTADEIKAEIQDMVKTTFTDPKNVGKALLTRHVFDHQGRPMKDIIVEPINFERDDARYTALEPIINDKITSSVGVPSHLASLNTSQGMSSGSELTQAMNIEKEKAHKARERVLKVINFVLRYNGWDENRKYSWGFHDPVMVTKDQDKRGIVPAEETTPDKPE